MKRTPITLFGALLFLAWLMPAQATPVYVDAAWLEQRLDDPSIVLVDMATDQTQYQRFHIPGAVYMPFGALVQRHACTRCLVSLASTPTSTWWSTTTWVV
jgi:hypothetical protein